MTSLFKEYSAKAKITNIEKIAKEFKKALYAFTSNKNTRTTMMAKLNSFIKKKFGDKFYKISYPILLPSKEDKLTQMKEQKQHYIEKLGDRIGIDAITYFSTIEKLKNSDDYYELCVVASLASGRRLTEIAKAGVFKPVANSENEVMFSGQLKTREDIRKPYKIYVLGLSAKDFIKLIKKIRLMRDFSRTVNDNVIAKVANGTNKIMHALFGKKVSTEIIRSAYIFICYRRFGDERISEVLFGNRLLGHRSDQLETTAVNYGKVFVYNLDMSDISVIRALNAKLDKLLLKLKT